MIHGVDYCTSLFALCRRPCHSELRGKPENFSIEMNREERLRRRRELYRLEKRPPQRHPHLYFYQPSLQNSAWFRPLRSRDLTHAIFAKSRDSFTRISHSTDIMTMMLLFYEMPVSQCMHSQAHPSMVLASV